MHSTRQHAFFFFKTVMSVKRVREWEIEMLECFRWGPDVSQSLLPLSFFSLLRTFKTESCLHHLTHSMVSIFNEILLQLRINQQLIQIDLALNRTVNQSLTDDFRKTLNWNKENGRFDASVNHFARKLAGFPRACRSSFVMNERWGQQR